MLQAAVCIFVVIELIYLTDPQRIKDRVCGWTLPHPSSSSNGISYRRAHIFIPYTPTQKVARASQDATTAEADRLRNHAAQLEARVQQYESQLHAQAAASAEVPQLQVWPLVGNMPLCKVRVVTVFPDYLNLHINCRRDCKRSKVSLGVTSKRSNRARCIRCVFYQHLTPCMGYIARRADIVYLFKAR